MQKAYNRIVWHNYPNTTTPVNETNLNKIDAGLNEVDNRVVALDTSKANQSDLLACINDIAYNSSTGVLVFTFVNGLTYTVDLNTEKIPVSFQLTNDGVLIMTTSDGTQWSADIADIIPVYTFVSSSKIAATTTTDSSGDKTVTFTIVAGSIQESDLETGFKTACITAKNEAEAAADSAQEDALKAEGYAVGTQDGTEVQAGSPYNNNNAKYYSELAEASADSALLSEANAAESESNASSSASLASTSATNAANSASSASTSATNAANSATSASASATNAANSATSAATNASSAITAASGASASAESANSSKIDAESYKDLALSYKNSASQSATAAATSASNAEESEESAGTSASSASENALKAEGYAIGTQNGTEVQIGSPYKNYNAKYYSDQAGLSASNAADSESNASSSESNAADSESNAEVYMNTSKSYAVGGTGTRIGEDTDNAKYYKEQCEQMVASLDGFKPMGTITFEQLPSVITDTMHGNTYNISNAFVSDTRFKDGSGKSYPAGTNVYITYDNMFDCFTGALPTVNNKTGASITLNGSDIALTGYTKATAKSQILATDSINLAFGKMEFSTDKNATDIASLTSRLATAEATITSLTERISALESALEALTTVFDTVVMDSELPDEPADRTYYLITS